MTETLAALDERITRERGRPARLAVWAHNSHLADARATEMTERGEVNVGQLVRERWGGEAFLLGFTTATGTVTAASDWGAAPECKRVRAPLDGSVEQLFTELRTPEFLLDVARARDALGAKRLERAIGVIYRPETERSSHYFRARVSEQFDALVHLDETTALEPLDASERWAGEPAETFPSGV